MPKRVISLTDLQVQKLKPQAKQYTKFDGNGLYILITPAGGKLWRFKYNFEGKQNLLAFGHYPETSLSEARDKRIAARKLLEKGIDPAAVRKAEKDDAVKQAETFEVIAREWHEKFKPAWSEGHAKTTLDRLEDYVFPIIGHIPIAEVKAPELREVLSKIEEKGIVDTAHRLRAVCGQILRYAVAFGKAEHDYSADLRGMIPAAKKSHMAAIIEPAEVGKLLTAIDGYQGGFVVKSALILAPLVCVRPGELRRAEWTEIDLENALWAIPGTKMKRRKEHIIPLSHQAVRVLKEIKPMTGQSRYVFPNGRSFGRPLSGNGVVCAIRVLGYDKDTMTGHGFRAVFRTLADEVLHERPDLIECQLGHAVRDVNGRAYNRTSFLDERRTMMQRWADYLDGLKAGAKVIPFRKTEG